MVDKGYAKSYKMWYKLRDEPQLTTYYLRHTTLLETKMRNGKTYKIVWAIESLNRFLKGFLRSKHSSFYDEEWWEDAIYKLCSNVENINMTHAKWSLEMDEMLATIKEEARRMVKDYFEPYDEDDEYYEDYKALRPNKIEFNLICLIEILKKFCWKLRDEGH